MKNYVVQRLYCAENDELLYQIIELITRPNGKTIGEMRKLVKVDMIEEGKRINVNDFEIYQKDNPGTYFELGRITISETFYKQLLTYETEK